MTIKIFKLVTGEMIISEVEKDVENYKLSYPLVIVPIPPDQANGMRNQIGFMKACPFSDYKEPIVLMSESVSIDSNPDKQIKEAYERQVQQIKSQESGIVMANSIPKEIFKNGKARDFSNLNI